MPMCHGAGGLAGQYRFGGEDKRLDCFWAGSNGPGGPVWIFADDFVRGISSQRAGCTAHVAGMELALVCRDQTSRTDAFAMLLTAGACMGLNNIAMGFLLGLAMAWCLRLGVFQVEEQATDA